MLLVVKAGGQGPPLHRDFFIASGAVGHIMPPAKRTFGVRLNEVAPDQALNALANGRVSREQAGKDFTGW